MFLLDCMWMKGTDAQFRLLHTYWSARDARGIFSLCLSIYEYMNTNIISRTALRVTPWAFTISGTVLGHLPERQSAEVREKSLLCLKYRSIYLTKMHGFTTGGLYSPPGAVWGTFYYGCAALYLCFRLLERNTHPLQWHVSFCWGLEVFKVRF